MRKGRLPYQMDLTKLSLSLLAQQRIVAFWTYCPCFLFVYSACKALLLHRPFGYVFATVLLVVGLAFFLFFRAFLKKFGPFPTTTKQLKMILGGTAIFAAVFLLAGLVVQVLVGRLPSSYFQMLLMGIGFFPVTVGLVFKCMNVS